MTNAYSHILDPAGVPRTSQVATPADMASWSPHGTDPPTNGQHPPDITEPDPDDNEPKIVGIGDIVHEFPSLKPPLIEGLLRREEVMNFISKSKVGKSWGVYGLGLSVVTGGEWLGRFPCKPNRVLLVDNELHGETLAHRIPTVAEAMQLRPEDYHDRFDVLSLRGRLRSIVDLSRVFKTIERGEYGLVILDAMYRAYPQGMSENDNAMMGGIYNLIDQYAAELSASFVLIHHASKGNQSDKDTTDVGSGAGSQSRAPDTHFVMRAHEQEECAVVDAALRSWAPIDPFVLRWNFPLWTPADDLDPAELKGTKQAKSNEARDKRMNDKRNRIVEYLMTVRESGATQSAIRDHTGISVALGQVLDSLVKDGNIQPCDVLSGRRTKQPCRGWKLVSHFDG